MQTPEDSVLLRIFISEKDRWHHQPLFEALVQKAQEMHLKGATVLRGPMGFGASSHLHTAKILDLSNNLPLVIEVVESEERIDAFLAVIDPMIESGLVTRERVKALYYRTQKAAEEKSQ